MTEMKRRQPVPAKKSKWGQVGAFVVMFCIIASLAMVHEDSIFGYAPGKPSERESVNPIRKTVDGEVVNTTDLGRDVIGYGGTVPLEIYIKGGRIDSIRALPNNETAEVFDRLYKEGLMKAWDGQPLDKAAALDVDAVSGATYSSNAVIANVRKGVAYAEGQKATVGSGSGWSASLVAALLVVLAGAVVPLFVHGNQRYRIVQQILNVAILGFWAGVFIDYAMMLNFFAHGVTFTLAGILTVVLLIVGLLYPLFGKPGHYCAWICPFGSLQELAGKIPARKLKLSPQWVKALDAVRNALWVVLLSFLFIGWAYQWIDYEIFTGFLVKSASLAVIIVGVAFVILSVFVNRPFCRFVCPTGTFLNNI